MPEGALPGPLTADFLALFVALAELFALYQAGQIAAPPTTLLPLKDFATALSALRDRTIRGRIVLVPDEATA